jgi:pSer/pThr/pTyr-binding forkhead associated (FHA) protein
MPVIKVNDQQYPLRPGQTRLGGGSDADVRLEVAGGEGIQAIVEMAGENRVVIKRASAGAVVRVNGVTLGVEPTPLMHGDKVEIAGQEILYSDDSKAGATQYVSAGDVAALAQKRGGSSRATASTGGRLVSLVDGKEYTISTKGVVIGRDASADVVVAEQEVSRKHAEITPSAGGYEITDHSANGVLVNGARIHAPQVLARSDVIKVGSEEFRFYADPAPVVVPAAPPAGTSRPVSPPVAAPIAPRPSPPPHAPAAAPPAMPAMSPTISSPAAKIPPAPAVAAPPPPPAAAPPVAAPVAPADPRPVLAVLEVTNEGITKGRIYEVRAVLAHIGRGAHNDVMIPDDSVSDTHAKLQRRDDGWYVVDAGSTNGTYVGGSRISGERRLDGAPDLRFGGVKTIFRVRDAAADHTKGTRAIAGIDRSRTGTPVAAPATLAAAATSPAPSPTRQPIPSWVWLAVVAAVVAVGAYLALNK